MHGKGVCTYSNGVKVIAEWEHGVLSGRGTTVMPNGNRYIGEYKDGFWEGVGVFDYTNGDRYTGELSKGLSHGKGIWYDARTGEETEGDWAYGEQVDNEEANCKGSSNPI
jgi:hypothetical protein